MSGRAMLRCAAAAARFGAARAWLAGRRDERGAPMEFLRPRAAPASPAVRLEQHFHSLHLRVSAAFQLALAARGAGSLARSAARRDVAGAGAGAAGRPGAPVFAARGPVRAADDTPPRVVASRVEDALRRVPDAARRVPDAARRGHGAAPVDMMAQRAGPGAHGRQGLPGAVAAAQRARPDAPPVRGLVALPPAPRQPGAGPARPRPPDAVRRLALLPLTRAQAAAAAPASLRLPSLTLPRSAAGTPVAPRREPPAPAPARPFLAGPTGMLRMRLCPPPAGLFSTRVASGGAADAAAPAALAHYAPPAPPLRVLREPGRAGAMAVQAQVDGLLQERLQRVERHVHTKVVHEIVHGAVARERIREAVGETLFSSKVLNALADRMYGALARRTAVERYRRETG